MELPDAKTGGWVVPLGLEDRAILADLPREDGNPRPKLALLGLAADPQCGNHTIYGVQTPSLYRLQYVLRKNGGVRTGSDVTSLFRRNEEYLPLRSSGANMFIKTAFVVYANESGDHGLAAIDPQYPVFALVFCAECKPDYIADVVPAVQRFKFGIWGHNAVVLHEHDICKSTGDPADRALREGFYRNLDGLVEAAPVTIFAAVIDKERLRT